MALTEIIGGGVYDDKDTFLDANGVWVEVTSNAAHSSSSYRIVEYGASLGFRETVSYTFSGGANEEGAVGVAVAITAAESGDVFDYTINGEDVNLQTMIDNGEAQIVDPVNLPFEINENYTTPGTIDSNGDYVPTHSSYDHLIISFNIPITSLSVRSAAGSPLSADRIDIYVDDQVNINVCFTHDTLIETDQGPVAVQDLTKGMMVRTLDSGFQPVRWIGVSHAKDCAIRIKAGTLGNARDLVVSPRHKMLMDQPQLSLMFDVDQAFACASDLKNGTTITQDAEGWVTYYHVLLPQHAVIYAEGAATESFYPDQGSLDGMASKTKADFLETFDPETYGPQARPTLTAVQAMWIARNLDILNSDDMGQSAAFEATQQAAQ